MSGDFDLLKAQRRIFESNLRPLERLVGLALLDHWSRTRDTFPSVSRLAGWTGMGERSVIRSLQELERREAIMVSRRTGRSNRYDLGALLSKPVPLGHPCQGDTTARLAPPPLPERHPTTASLAPEGTQDGTQVKEPTTARATKGSPTKGARKAKRSKQPEIPLPTDWQPTEAHRAYAAKHGLSIDFEVDSFKGWADGRAQVSWNGTFTTRLANQAKWNRERGPRKGQIGIQRGGMNDDLLARATAAGDAMGGGE